MDPKYENDDGRSLDDTVRVMRTHTSERARDREREMPDPGLRFRQDVAAGFEKVAERLGKIEVRLARIDERQLPRATITDIAKTEMAVTVDRLDRLSSIVYGLCGAFAISFIGACVALLFSLVNKK